MKKILYIAMMFATLCSCSKEIDLDYNDIEPVPVIEGHLSNGEAVVTITKSRNMSDSTKTPGIQVEDVRIILPDGNEVPLSFSNGNYRNNNKIDLEVGSTYTLKVTMDGVEYTGSSTLQPKVEISEPVFRWVYLMDWYQVLEIVTTNVPDDQQFYGWARIHRNGKIYFTDAAGTKGNYPFEIGLYYDSDMENDEDMILNDGDTLLIEVRTIDEPVFKYIYEYNSTKVNPRQFFKTSVENKVCMGFFAVYASETREVIYKKTAHEE